MNAYDGLEELLQLEEFSHKRQLIVLLINYNDKELWNESRDKY
jgi:hypothetical protein